MRIDFTQTITSGSRLRYILRNGDDTANVAILDNNLSNTYANGSGSFFYYLKIDDGLQVRILSETNTGTLDSFTSTLTQNGDFQFSRGSDATRINSQGLVESVQVISGNLVQNGDFEEIGSELIVNGGFDDASSWNPQSSWTIQGGKAVYDGVNTHSINQSVSLVANKSYELSFDLSDVGPNNAYINVRFLDGSVIYETTYIYYEEGTHKIYFKPTANTNLMQFYASFNGSSFKLDNISINLRS